MLVRIGVGLNAGRSDRDTAPVASDGLLTDWPIPTGRPAKGRGVEWRSAAGWLNEPPVWGWSSHPILEDGRLICLIGGSNSVVVAFDQNTGKPVWQALNAPDIGYAPPMVWTVDGERQSCGILTH